MRAVAVAAAPTLVVCAALSCDVHSTGDPALPTDIAGGFIASAPLPAARPASDAGQGADAIAPAALACDVRLDAQTILGASHVPVGTVVAYNSNPPSNGPHYPIWANFQEYATPVPDPYLVHSMEHGAVVLFYKCAAPCEATVDVLRAVRNALPLDPICPPDIGRRVIIVPRPELDDVVAAAAWGFTYRAECADLASLTDFALAHYGKGPEDLCGEGQTTF